MAFEVTKFVCLCLIANFVIITDKHKIVAAAPLSVIPVEGRAADGLSPIMADRSQYGGKISRVARTRLFFENNGKFKSSEEERHGEMVNIAHIVVEEI